MPHINIYTKEQTDAKLTLKADSSDLASVATSGSYTDLLNKPSIPSVAQDVGAISTSALVTSMTELSTDAQVPSAKAVYTGLSGKMNTTSIDSAPTENSTNLVTSGGVFTAINNVSSSYIIEATITLSSGTGDVSGITVTATASGYDTLIGTTDENGVVQFTGAKVGVTYSITATKTDYTFSSSTIRIEHLINTVAITAVKNAIVTITVTDDSGASVNGLVVNGTGASNVSGTTDVNGVVVFSLGVMGEYTFSLDASSIPTGGRVDSTSVTAVGGSVYEGSITITHPFGYTIVCIAKPSSSPGGRCTYPESVTINGKTYTNSAPSQSKCAKGTSLGGWVGHKLIEGIKPVLKNGTTWTELDKSSSASWSTSGDAFTEFPFRWLGFYSNSTYTYVLFSDDIDNPDSTIFNDYAFLNNSNVRQVNTHIGCFDADYTSSVLGSKRGSTVKVSTSLTDFITYASLRGTDYDIITYWQAQYLTALFVTLYMTTDCQGQSYTTTGLGYGFTESNSAPRGNTGVAFGNNYGMYGTKSDYTSAVVFFWIHDIWGSVSQWVGGARTNGSRQLETCVGKMSSTSQTDFNLTESTSGTYPTSDIAGYLTDVAGTVKSGFFPIASSSNGSATTYYQDYATLYASRFLYWGGSSIAQAGLFNWRFNDNATYTYVGLGSRLSYKGGRTVDFTTGTSGGGSASGSPFTL